MKKPKISKKLKSILNELHNSRNEIEEFNFNFLGNIYRYATLMHKLIEVRLDSSLFEVAVSQYVASLVSCWETFFRDTFIFVVSNNEKFRSEIIKIVEVNHQEAKQLDNGKLVTGYLSKCFNFQNLNDIENAFSPIFGHKLFVTIGKYIFPILGVDGRISFDFCYETITPNYLEVIGKVYEERHKIIHDANYRLKMEVTFIQNAESSFVIFPQLFTIALSNKMNLPLAVIEDTMHQCKAPYIFTIKDILSTEWVVQHESDEV